MSFKGTKQIEQVAKKGPKFLELPKEEWPVQSDTNVEIFPEIRKKSVGATASNIVKFTFSERNRNTAYIIFCKRINANDYTQQGNLANDVASNISSVSNA